MDFNKEAWKVTRKLMAGETSVEAPLGLGDTIAYQMRYQRPNHRVRTIEIDNTRSEYRMIAMADDPWFAKEK